MINRNAYVFFVKKSALCISECITGVAHWEVSCTRANLVFVLCWTLPTLALKAAFFWGYSCFESDEKGAKNAIMSVKWSSGEHCIIPACELSVVWFSVRVNQRWKMTRSSWLCASFIPQLFPSEALCKQLDVQGTFSGLRGLPATEQTARQSLAAPLQTDPAPLLGHLVGIHLSSK